MRLLLLAALLAVQRPAAPPLQTGTVTGRLLNPDGSAAQKIRVSAMSIPESPNSANDSSALITLTETDNTGRYRLTDVPAGRYYIVAGFVDSPTYYPRGTLPTAAAPVNVTANGTVTLNDFRIEKPSTGLTVSGRLINESNQFGSGVVQVVLSGGPSGAYTNQNVPLKLDGSFEFLRVRPGNYNLTVSPYPFPLSRTVVVGEADVTGLEVLLPWTTEVSGRVIVDGGGPVPTFNVSFTGGNRQATAYQSNQAFRATLAEGFYGVYISNIPAGFYVKSIGSGTVDLLSEPYRVVKPATPTEIVVTLGVSTPSPWVRLSGHLTGAKPNTVTTLTLNGPIGNLETQVGPDGSFELPRVLPGTYSAYVRSNTATAASAVSIVVPNRDLAGIELALPAVKEISGRIAVEDGGPFPRFALILSEVPSIAKATPNPGGSTPTLAQLLVTTNGAVNGIRPLQTTIGIAVQQDGSFKASLPEGSYQIAANITGNGSAPPPYSLKAFTYGARNVLKDPIVVSTTEDAELGLTFAPVSSGSWVKVSGKVTGLTGSQTPPTVTLNNPSFYFSVSTPLRPDGSFEFPKVYPGSYQARLLAANVGGLPAVEVSVGTRDVTGVDFAVPRQKEITGRIVMEGRGALPQFNIPLINVATNATGLPVTQMALNINPQSNGTFKVTLPEGERQLGRPNGIPTAYTLKSITYGTTNLASSPFKISATDTAELVVTISTTDNPPVKVAGKVTGLDPSAFVRGPINVSLNAPSFASTLQAVVSADGSFEFPAVFPGSYTARLTGNIPNINLSTTSVNVANADITNVQIALPRQKEIAGRITMEGRGPMPQFSMQVTGTSSGSINFTTFVTINPQPDGTFRITLPEGERRLGLPNGLPPGYTLKSMVYGSSDLMSVPMKISAADTDELRIAVSSRTDPPVKIGGKVTGLEPESFSRGPVYVYLNAPGYAGTMQTIVSTNGAFAFNEVFPGTYGARVAGPGVVSAPVVSVVVSNKDIQNLEITVPTQKEIRGRIVVEGPGPLPRVAFRPLGNAAPIGLIQGNPATYINLINAQPDGTFRITLPEGEHPLGEPIGLPPGYTLKSATYGTVDLLRNPLKVTKTDTAQLLLTFSVANAPPVSFSGRVEGVAPAVLTQGAVRVVLTTSTYLVSPSVAVRPDGSFEFPSIFPGNYIAAARVPGLATGGTPVPIVVRDAAVKDVVLVVPRERPVTARIVVEGGGPLFRVPLSLGTPGAGGNVISVAPQSDGTSRISLPEGERSIGALQLPPGYALKSLSYGSTDLRQAPLKINMTDPAEELRVTLEKTVPTPWVNVSGRVVGLPPETRNIRVSLTGTFSLPQESPLNTDGTFSFSQVLQGASTIRLAGNIEGPLPNPVSISVGATDVTDVEIVVSR
jgi:hypothetical protein